MKQYTAEKDAIEKKKKEKEKKKDSVVTKKDFGLSENAKVYFLVLKPNQKMIKSLFTEIDLLVAKSDFTVDRIDLKETSGDSTTLIFSNKKINTPVPDEVFIVN
jgi:outer membrane lipoprotein-sorting protein